MNRHAKALVVVSALLMALVLTVLRRDSHRLAVSAGAVTHAAADPRPYDLAALRIFNSALMHINDSYVDPTRVDPKAMLLAALDQVQKSVAEVMVELPMPSQEGSATPAKVNIKKVHIRVDTAQQEFDVSDVDSPWSLSLKMREIFRFVGAHIEPDTDVKEIEYAATNGMLSTLDPHSVLLDPTIYNEMKLTTKGQFGGLGIVIGIRKGHLTVIRPLPKTPASEAGVKAGDKIVRIEKESTVNMMLNDAVSRLRGEPGSKVEVWTQRGDTPARRLLLTRAIIQVDSIQAHLLKGGIGYVRMSQFSGNGDAEMRRAIEELRGKSNGSLKGLVLDLRSDPGGLLDQAIRVADEFLDSGTIVTTVGYANKQRDEKRAQPGNQPHIPMAVLVNSTSASASEIVAGALKNLDRAVVLGTRTFGKGSVQVLYDNDDGSALKLTIAQYLTPGDVSIQSVGIVPDVLLEPSAITKDRVALFHPRHALREQDLSAHLTSGNARNGDKPIERLRFLAPKLTKKKVDEAAPLGEEKAEETMPQELEDEEEAMAEAEEGDRFVEDYPITLARDLLIQAKGWRRREVLAQSRPFFQKKSLEEEQKIAEALRELAVDWSVGTAAGTPQLEAKLTTNAPSGHITAGGKVELTATVTNRGSNVAWRVHALSKCDNLFFEDREFVFGRLAPGETRSWTVPLKIDRAALARLDRIRLEVYDEKGGKLAEARTQLIIDGQKRPRFAYAYQLIDDVKGGNADGTIQSGESLRLHVTVKNVGEGKSFETLATLSNKSGDGVSVNKGRFNVDHLAPGDSKSVDFTFDVAPDFKEKAVTLQMDVYDQVLHEYVTDRLTFPIGQEGKSETANGSVTVLTDQAEVRAGAAAGAPVIGRVAKGASFRVTGRVPGFYRIEVEPGRQAFLDAKTTSEPRPGSGVSSSSTLFTPTLQVVPPKITVDNPPLAVDDNSFRLIANASDERRVADVFIFVSNRSAKVEHRKVFYRSNRTGQDPKSIRFEAVVPLWAGANQVTVVARQSTQVQAQQTLIVQGKGEPPPRVTSAY